VLGGASSQESTQPRLVFRYPVVFRSVSSLRSRRRRSLSMTPPCALRRAIPVPWAT